MEEQFLRKDEAVGWQKYKKGAIITVSPKHHFQHNLDKIQPSPYFIGTYFNTDILDSYTNDLDIMPEFTLYTTT